jgi:muramidase (phage lysozyme)
LTVSVEDSIGCPRNSPGKLSKLGHNRIAPVAEILVINHTKQISTAHTTADNMVTGCGIDRHQRFTGHGHFDFLDGPCRGQAFTMVAEMLMPRCDEIRLGVHAIPANISEAIGADFNFEQGGVVAAQNVALHSVMGGIASVVQGGKFGHGFFSSMVSTSMKFFMEPQTGTYGDAVRRTMVAGMVGGTVSALTGGKFANGAITSAIQWWYNAEGAKTPEQHRSAARARAEALLKDNRVKAMLEVIAERESRGEYDAWGGNKKFSGFDRHPGMNSTGGSAAGKYQILIGTWNSVANQLGLTDFSPLSQDLAAVALLQETGAIYQLQLNNSIGAISLASNQWEALPHTVRGNDVPPCQSSCPVFFSQ